MKDVLIWIVLCLIIIGLPHVNADPVILEDFETLTGWKAEPETASFKQAASAAVGQGAIQVTLPRTVFKQISSRPIEGSAAWDRYEGISFWVKGDGSDLFGSLAVGPSASGSYTYVCYFPLKNTEWHRVAVAWADLAPEGQYDPIGASGALPPSGIQAIRFGSRWVIYTNNAKIPEHTYCVDHIQIEEKVEGPAPPPKPRPFSDVPDLLKSKKKIHIVCMGDSITAGTALADKDKERYAVRMQELLREWLGYGDILCDSRAVGGARLTDARAWAPRDFAGEPPDLVTILYGYNDKSGAYTRDYFKRSLNDYIDRIARETGGKAAIWLLTTIPGTGPRFVMMDDYADAVRETAKERGLACFDLQKVFKDVGRDKIEGYFADQAHPNAEGHQVIADAIATFLVTSAGITTPKPKPKPKAAAPPGKEQTWAFESDAAEWQIKSDEIALSQEKASSGATALKFSMKSPAKGHRCAYSPAFPVSEGQRYCIEAKAFCADVTNGTVGIYVCSFTNQQAEGSPEIKSVRNASNTTGRWETLKGDFTVPADVVALKVMVWSRDDSVGTFYVDDVHVIPE
ncbi:MAG: GDSL-type esterase/lipase family protein [Planctomycetota bacterium]